MSGGLADTYALFQLLGIPYTITNVILYTLFTIVIFVLIIGVCAYMGSR